MAYSLGFGDYGGNYGQFRQNALNTAMGNARGYVNALATPQGQAGLGQLRQQDTYNRQNLGTGAMDPLFDMNKVRANAAPQLRATLGGEFESRAMDPFTAGVNPDDYGWVQQGGRWVKGPNWTRFYGPR